MPEIFKRAAARRDLIEHYVYLAQSGGEDLADRFLVCAEESFADLGAQPEIGAHLVLRRPELAGLRKWRIKQFESVLIFYCRDLAAYRSSVFCMPRRIGGACSASSRDRSGSEPIAAPGVKLGRRTPRLRRGKAEYG